MPLADLPKRLRRCQCQQRRRCQCGRGHDLRGTFPTVATVPAIAPAVASSPSLSSPIPAAALATASGTDTIHTIHVAGGSLTVATAETA